MPVSSALQFFQTLNTYSRLYPNKQAEVAQQLENLINGTTVPDTIIKKETKTNDKIVLSISDNGIGIPKSDLPRIFEKGFTGQNGRTGKNSTGIGLYLCKRLCDKLGIGLTAYSENRGTTISLIFQMNDFIIGVQG
ncbi:ATP-binding protein [[Ruminococcus] torques]|uniref:ATP-binding protein n=1 Tax=[Ruminococcus] torques TaxID=33039 RepID=UPI002E8DDD2B|nr:ATP-binding protein [[Ruminococcus] torques]